MPRIVWLTVFVTMLLTLSACGHRDGKKKPTAPALDLKAVAKFQRTVEWPYEYANKLVDADVFASEGKWDRVISIYDSMLVEKHIKDSANLRAEVFTRLADAHLAVSNGTDVASYLLYLSLALEECTSAELKLGLIGQMRAACVGLDRRRIADKWSDLEGRYKARQIQDRKPAPVISTKPLTN